LPSEKTLDTTENPNEFFNNLFPVVAQATAKKLKAEEIRAYADKAAKLAEAYGPVAANRGFPARGRLGGARGVCGHCRRAGGQGERLLAQ